MPFFGHIISAKGLCLDPKKTQAILNMDPSKSLTDQHSFLGMTQYLSRFIPNLASISANLWDLTKKSNQFLWGPEHQSAVEHIKAMVTSPNSLQYFDGTKPVAIQVDASMRGLGVTLIQDKGPVEYLSKFLTETETRYSNIEREMLAVVQKYDITIKYVPGKDIPLADALSRLNPCQGGTIKG